MRKGVKITVSVVAAAVIISGVWYMCRPQKITEQPGANVPAENTSSELEVKVDINKTQESVPIYEEIADEETGEKFIAEVQENSPPQEKPTAPPDPKANERNDTFSLPPVLQEEQTPVLSWGVWSAAWHEYWVWESDWEWTGTRWVDNGQWVDNGWYDFTFNRYSARLNTTQSIKPGAKVPTAAGAVMKSGYGFGTEIVAATDTNAPANAFTQAQTGTMKFPEFEYKTYFRVLDKNISAYKTEFWFKKNRYSTFESRTHFTPIWYPDGAYTVFTKIYDAWTPAGMLSVNGTPALSISGNMFSDWHIAPKNIQ